MFTTIGRVKEGPQAMTEQHTSSHDVVVGIDVGGTTTRAVAITHRGEVSAIGRAAGANPSTRSPNEIRAAISTALHAALSGIDQPTITAVTIGMAGLDPYRDRQLDISLRNAIAPAPKGPQPVLCSDTEITFAAASRAPDGIVLIAGTGAIASRIQARTQAGTVDGHGWRLGDTGSGYWLGAAVLRQVLEHLDGRHERTDMTVAVIDQLKLSRHDSASRLRWQIVQATIDMHPSEIAAFAAIALTVEDSAAHQLIADAAEELQRTVNALQPRPGEPIVLGGGLLRDTTLGARLSDLLTAQGLHATIINTEPVMGAAALAAESVGWNWP